MPLIKHYNPKSYIINGVRVIDAPNTVIAQPIIHVGSSYWNRYRGNNNSNGAIFEQLNNNRKRRNGN